MFGLQALRRGPAAVIAMLLMVALIASACGGDSDGDNGNGGDGASPTTAAASGDGTAAPSGDGGSGTSDDGDDSNDSNDASDGFGSVDELTSYRYTMTMQMGADAFGTEGMPEGMNADDMTFGVEVEGETVAPDRNRTKMVADLGFMSFNTERIQIGDKAWVRENGGAWQPEAESDSLAGDLNADIDPDDFFGEGEEGLAELKERIEDHPYEEETVEGIQTRRYEFTQEEYSAIFETGEALPTDDEALADSKITLWLAEDLGVPVKMLMEGLNAEGETALSMEMRIFDINADDISIEPPL